MKTKIYGWTKDRGASIDDIGWVTRIPDDTDLRGFLVYEADLINLRPYKTNLIKLVPDEQTENSDSRLQ